jgi:hypothetical protein
MALGSDTSPRNGRGDLRGGFRLPALAFPQRARQSDLLPSLHLPESVSGFLHAGHEVGLDLLD